MKKGFKLADLVLVVFVVATAAMLIVPLPTALLDLLLVINISFSILLLLVGLYTPSSALLYTFPTVLLLSTLFRLGLNVASSRLILSQGDAGRVIESFGTFLISGEIVVGVIVFCIITIVNFIVISKGASRVSEVAARFFLDALPGKQVAIDNDTRAGLISANEAKQKRDALNREGQLYGSMDGAMNFVQGDAIAGFFIIIANIVGGIYLGISGGMGIQDAIQTYTILTIGDGLVTQIPSLLTSICAGIVVTRVASSEIATLSSDLRNQFFSQPSMLFATAAILILFGFLPGIPAIPFTAVALSITAGAVWLIRYKTREQAEVRAGSGFGRENGLPAPTSPVAEIDYDGSGLIIRLDSSMLHRMYLSQPDRFTDTWRTFRNEFLADVGILLPDAKVQADALLAPASFAVISSGTESITGSVIPDAILVEVGTSQAFALGIEVLAEEDHPLTGHRILWTTNTQVNRQMLEAASIRFYDLFEYICIRTSSFATRYPEEFISVTDVHSLLRQIEKKNPGLVGEGFGKDFLSVPRLADILHELVRQGVSIRDFRGILESVSSYCGANGITVASEQSIDTDSIVSYIRSAKRRPLLRRFIGGGKSLRILVLSDKVEEVFEEAEVENSVRAISVDEEILQGLTAGLQQVLRPAIDFGVSQVGILCRADVRQKILAFLRHVGRPLYVVAFEELDGSVPVEQVGTWNLVCRG